jgi:hypothetical protein
VAGVLRASKFEILMAKSVRNPCEILLIYYNHFPCSMPTRTRSGEQGAVEVDLWSCCCEMYGAERCPLPVNTTFAKLVEFRRMIDLLLPTYSTGPTVAPRCRLTYIYVTWKQAMQARMQTLGRECRE